MSRFIFDLTDEDRGALEAHRVRLGLRSHAETLRWLIRGDELSREMQRQEAVRWSRIIGENQKLRDAGDPAALGPKDLVKKLVKEREAKPEPFKTRLKGEWSPPGGKAR